MTLWVACHEFIILHYEQILRDSRKQSRSFERRTGKKLNSQKKKNNRRSHTKFSQILFSSFFVETHEHMGRRP